MATWVRFARMSGKVNPQLQRMNIEGIGHPFWIYEDAGFTSENQSDVIAFVLSLDDDSAAVLPSSVRETSMEANTP